MQAADRQTAEVQAMRHFAFFLATIACTICSLAGSAEPSLRVSDNQRHLVRADAAPFFYLGDTAWELFHRLDREQADRYLEGRAAKGFTVIQAVALAEEDGLNTPNSYGHRPLIENDPTRPDVRPGERNDYWDHVDYIVERAESLGMFIGMLPTWGDKWNKAWGVGPVVFTPENAEAYGEWLGRRYRDRPIIWILGGDRPVENDTHREIITAMARGLERGDDGRHLMTFRGLFESRPFWKLESAQSLISGANPVGPDHVRAARAAEGTFAVVYLPTGKPVTLNLQHISGESIHAWWFNPRQNSSQLIGTFQRTSQRTFAPPSSGRNNDWVLVVDDASQDLPRLGWSYQNITPVVDR
jgi:hypothetical protein